MHLKKSLLVLAITLAGGGVAQADNVLSVTATYSITGDNTSITVTNLSSSNETNVDINSGGSTISLGTIAAGHSDTYSFNDNNGPFLLSPGDADLPDTTTYDVTATFQGSTVTSNSFSPVTNLTGGYVDFLGDCFLSKDQCSIDPNSNYPETGVVAAAANTAVPLSPTFVFLLSGLAGVAARTVRRRV